MDNKKEQKKNEKTMDVGKKTGDSSQVPFIDLTERKIPIDVLKEIPEEAASFYGFVPIDKKGDVLEVGMVDPGDLRAKEALRFIAQRNGLRLEAYLITKESLKNVLNQYRTLRGEVQKALKELEKELEEKEEEKKSAKKKEDVSEIAERIVAEAPITKIVAVILRHATEGRASDVHIEPTEENTKVRFRVDGVLYTSLILPPDIQSSVISRIKILATLKIDETRVPQDGRFHAKIGGKKIDFRVSTFPTVGGEKAVLRVLDPSLGLKTFTDLGLDGYNLETLEEGIKKPYGMILITGPTGSGKTTTLYSILNKLNCEGSNIVSLEDPVEYYVEGVNQSQIRPEINYTFATGLRHILRQDPDIIMVGEIRDEETADLAIHAALTGHILLSTLHTNNAMGVIPRLVDMGIGPFLLPPSLNLAVAQRLVRRLCPKCKKKIKAPSKIERLIDEELERMVSRDREKSLFEKPYYIYRGEGCELCGGKGTKGRIALYEMIKMSSQLEEVVNEGMSESKIKEEGKRQGMITMKQDGVMKALKGLISFEEMLKAVSEH